MTKRKKTVVCLCAALGILAAAFVAYVLFFALSARALPGTKIGNVSVTGMTRAQICAELEKSAQTEKITFSGEGIRQTQATLADMGYTLDARKTADLAFASGRSPIRYLTGLFTSDTTAPLLVADAEKTQRFADKIIVSAVKDRVREPAVSAVNGKFTVTEGKPGRGVDPQDIEAGARKLAAAQKSLSFPLQVKEINPQRQAQEFSRAANEANRLLSAEVRLRVGEDTISPTKEEKIPWVSINQKDVSFNRDKVKEWISAKTSEISHGSTKGVRAVDKDGVVIRIIKKAVPEVHVTNSDEIVKTIIEQLEKNNGATAEVKTKTGELQWEDRIIETSPDGKQLAYQPTAGEKWIDVNLSTFKMTAYEGTTVVRGPITVVTGTNRTPTAEGTFKIWHKTAKQDMRGTGPDGTPYLTKDVPWNMFFKGSYAIHGAPWWHSWGFQASHGCVNTPVPHAKWLYDWAPQGTTVVVHH